MPPLNVRRLGRVDYLVCWEAMKAYTDARDASWPDELWLLEHPPVFTQGQAGKAEHVLASGDIPVIQVDRGGQVTYHGPGQLVVYLLVDIRRSGLGVRALVDCIEDSVIEVLQGYGVSAETRAGAPGVYLRRDGSKIAALGLRVRRGCSFHGLALNLDVDLEPYGRINPCGYAGQTVASLRERVDEWRDDEWQRIEGSMTRALAVRLGHGSWRQLRGLPEPVGIDDNRG